MKKYIEVNLQYEATHYWPDCNLNEVKYLRNEHRHIFHITLRKEVFHNERDIEIIMLKNVVESYMAGRFNKKLGAMSCESLAEELLRKFNCDYVKVLEDNENGALIIK